jgi:hypothetical protein
MHTAKYLNQQVAALDNHVFHPYRILLLPHVRTTFMIGWLLLLLLLLLIVFFGTDMFHP